MKQLLVLFFSIFLSQSSRAQTKEETIEWLNLYGASLLAKDFRLPNFDMNEGNQNRYSFTGYEVNFTESSMSISFRYEYDRSRPAPGKPSSRDYANTSFNFNDIYLPESFFAITEADVIPCIDYPIPCGWSNKKLKPEKPFYKMLIPVRVWHATRVSIGIADNFDFTDSSIEIVSLYKENLERVGKAILNMAKLNGAKAKVKKDIF